MRVKAKRVIFAIACFCGFVGIFYYDGLRQSNSFDAMDWPTIPPVNNGTGILSISQHQMKLKTNHSRNLHNVRVHFSSHRSRNSRRRWRRSSTRSQHENLDWYTLPKPTNEEVQERIKEDDKLEEKFLHFNDERSVKRIVNGLIDSEEKLPVTFRKEGMPKKRLPNAIIVGVRKGGTRALLEMIKIHPQVCSCGPEIHYFDRHYNKDLQWYRNRMPLCYENEIIIEKTPSYFVTNGVAKDMFEYSKHLNETLKLIVIVRDPSRRAISDYTQTLSNYYSLFGSAFPQTFEELALRHSHDGKAQVNSQWGAVKIGVYSKHLKRWLRYFSRTQIHIVSGEILIKEPYQELRKVEEFLQLPKFIKPEHFVYNKTKGFYCFDESAIRMNEINKISFNDTNFLTLRCLGSSKGRTHVLVSNETEQLLHNYYRPFNQELYGLIGRNFRWP